MLETSFPDIEVVGECASVAESVARLREKPDEADLIFMDVELSDGECFEIFRQVTVKKPVVMTTAYDSYAVKAFEAGSIDYLLKPIDASALKRAVERCRQFSTGDLDVEKILGAISRKDSGHGYKERYLVQFNDRIVPVGGRDRVLLLRGQEQSCRDARRRRLHRGLHDGLAHHRT